jgi:(2R)-sulfolactate sulfo-lyase subunit alpha
MTDNSPTIQFLVHAKSDTVGVATVDLTAGQTVRGQYMDTQEALELEARNDIPLGHKIALKDHKVGEIVIKYEHDIGAVVADIGQAEHVHTHNLKTKRW